MTIFSFMEPPKLIRRIVKDGFEQIGYITRPKDTRTEQELQNNLKYWAKHSPEIAKFKKDLEKLKPETLGLVSDICEIAQHKELIPESINMLQKSSKTNKNLLETLIENIIKAEKENPASLILFKEIIDNTSYTPIKYALASLQNLLTESKLAEKIEATIPLIKETAKATLSGFSMSFAKEKQFVNWIYEYLNPKTKLDKLKILPQILEAGDKAKTRCIINANPFLKSSTPISKIKENLETFKAIDPYINNPEFDLSYFLTHNENLI